MIRGYKIRIYPTAKQKVMIHQHVGASRFIWNYMFMVQQERYKNHEKHLTGFDMCKLLTTIKQDPNYKWLYEVSNATLQTTCMNLSDAYIRFFKGISGHPKLKKKKKAKKAFPLRSDGVYFQQGCIVVRKIGAIRYKTDHCLPNDKQVKIINPNISVDGDKYFFSFCLESESQASNKLSGRMGIDVGIKEFAVVAYETEQYQFFNINKSQKIKSIEEKINYYQKILSRKLNHAKRKTGAYRLSNNAFRCVAKLQKLYRKATNIRCNYIHHITSYLCGLCPEIVIVEDLDLVSLGKNAHMKKQVRDQNFSEFYRQLEYKTFWHNISFVKADRYFPSSKTCSHCGHVKSDLRLSDRTYVCPVCGNQLDRDYNAALNLMRYMS